MEGEPLINAPSDSMEGGDQLTKKRRKYGRLSQVAKKINLMSHEMGENCNCRLQCFDNVPEDTRRRISKEFNLMESVDLQNAYLCGLISVLPIQRRRPRKDESEARFNNATYKYRVRGQIGDGVKEVVVCRKAFMAMHGISKSKIQYLVHSLRTIGKAPTDNRGKHGNRPWKLSDETVNAIKQHIGSFPGRNSHYGLKDTTKVYLSEELNISKMFSLFKEAYPTIKASYESYRDIFNTKFNISFGYPRTDTCSECDEYTVKVKCLEMEKQRCTEISEIRRIESQLKNLKTLNDYHKFQASTFYDRKRKAKRESRKSMEKEAICIDFGRNLPLPNITTNTVYYKRQLSLYAFNIHRLSNADSTFFLYPECVAKKGSDDVCSMIHTYCYNYLDIGVKYLDIFCDSCSGQNKNYTLIRFLHNLVTVERRFHTVKVTFPIRGHSYLECDKNMGLINKKAHAEVPKDWTEVFISARSKPSPFNVVEATSENFRQWTAFLKPFYKQKCPFPTRPVRELIIDKSHPRLVKFRTTYNGAWEAAALKLAHKTDASVGLEFDLPQFSYTGKFV